MDDTTITPNLPRYTPKLFMYDYISYALLWCIVMFMHFNIGNRPIIFCVDT